MFEHVVEDRHVVGFLDLAQGSNADRPAQLLSGCDSNGVHVDTTGIEALVEGRCDKGSLAATDIDQPTSRGMDPEKRSDWLAPSIRCDPRPRFRSVSRVTMLVPTRIRRWKGPNESTA